jgi:hypothetical protein
MGSVACANKGTSFRLAATDKICGLSVTTLSHKKGTQVAVKQKEKTVQQDHRQSAYQR